MRTLSLRIFENKAIELDYMYVSCISITKKYYERTANLRELIPMHIKLIFTLFLKVPLILKVRASVTISPSSLT